MKISGSSGRTIIRKNGGIIFPNPNAPTSIYEELEFVEDILDHNKGKCGDRR